MRRPGFWILLAAGCTVIAVVVGAIAVMGSPQAQRRVRQDERRIEDLQRIAALAQMLARTQGRLPADLGAIASQPGRRVTNDPFTGAPYEYMVLDARRYRLCAKFDTDSATTDGEPGRYEFAGVSPEWQHPAGRYCFDRLVERAD